MAEEDVLLVEDEMPYYWDHPLFELREYRTSIKRRSNASVVSYVDDDLRPVNKPSRLLMEGLRVNPGVFNGQCVELPLGNEEYMYLLVVADKENRHCQDPKTLRSCLKLLRDMCVKQAVEWLDIPVDSTLAISCSEFKKTIEHLFEKSDVNVTLYKDY